MKVICEVDYSDYYTGSYGKVSFKFVKGQVYEMLTEYNNCYLYFYNGETFLVKKLYFLSIQQVLKRKLLSLYR